MLGEGISSRQPPGRTVKHSAPHYPGGEEREQGLSLGHLSPLLPPWVCPPHSANWSHPHLVIFIHLHPSNNSYSSLEKVPLNDSAEMGELPQLCAGTKKLEAAQSSCQAWLTAWYYTLLTAVTSGDQESWRPRNCCFLTGNSSHSILRRKQYL